MAEIWRVALLENELLTNDNIDSAKPRSIIGIRLDHSNSIISAQNRQKIETPYRTRWRITFTGGLTSAEIAQRPYLKIETCRRSQAYLVPYYLTHIRHQPVAGAQPKPVVVGTLQGLAATGVQVGTGVTIMVVVEAGRKQLQQQPVVPDVINADASSTKSLFIIDVSKPPA